MALDTALEVAPLHTITATETTGLQVIRGGRLGYSSYLQTITFVVQYWNALQASGSGTWIFSMELSYDKGATWTSSATGATLTLSTTGQNGQQVLSATPNVHTDSGEVWAHLVATLGGSGVSPTIAYRCDRLAPLDH